MAAEEFDEVLGELASLGTEQNRKIYPRHGATEPIYGVSYADLDKIARRYRGDHTLADGLWASGVHDARILATKIADPSQLTARQADAWIRDCDNYVVVEALAGVVAAAPCGPARGRVWRGRKQEWVASAGWAIAAHLAMADDGMADEEAFDLLARIEDGIASAQNRVRHEMNGALIAIGLRSPELREAALAVAGRIGPVEVDHGQTNCKTPDAVDYINRVVAGGRAGRKKR